MYSSYATDDTLHGESLQGEGEHTEWLLIRGEASQTEGGMHDGRQRLYCAVLSRRLGQLSPFECKVTSEFQG